MTKQSNLKEKDFFLTLTLSKDICLIGNLCTPILRSLVRHLFSEKEIEKERTVLIKRGNIDISCFRKTLQYLQEYVDILFIENDIAII